MHFNQISDLFNYANIEGTFWKLYILILGPGLQKFNKDFAIDNIIQNIQKDKKPGIAHTFHSFIEKEYPFQKRMTETADITTLLNKAKEAEFKKYFTNTPYEIIPNMVNSHHNKEEELLNLKNELAPNGEKILLYVGRLEKEKGIYSLAHSINELYKTEKNIKVVIVGSHTKISTEHVTKMKEILRKPINDNKIKFTGWISEEQVSAYQQVGDLQIAPSYTEAFSLAMAKGI